MKFLRDRKEIAKKINLEHVPVLTIDLDHDKLEGYEDCYKGSKINLVGVYRTDSEMYCGCTVEMYGDEKGNENHAAPWLYKRIRLCPENVCLHASYCLSDVLETVEWSNARVARPGDEVIVLFVSKEKGSAAMRLMKIGSLVDPFCTTATMLVDVDE